MVANIQLLWKLLIFQAMRDYQRTSTSLFIGYFALTPEPLVRLSRNFVLRILYTRGRSGMNFIQPKKCWSSGGPSSLQMTICKGTEEHRRGWVIQMVICNNPCSSVPLILVIWRTVLFANDHLQRNGGTIVALNNCCKEQLSRGTIVMWNNCREGHCCKESCREGH